MTPRIPIRYCKKCPHYHGHCPLADLDPCPMAEYIDDDRMRTRIGVVMTLIVGIIIAAIILFAGCTPKKPEPKYIPKFTTMELLHLQHDDLSRWDKLILAIAFTESRFRPEVVGTSNDTGILQITHPYVNEVNRLYNTDYILEDAFDIGKSIEMYDLLQGYYNPNKNIEEAIRYHNKSPQYRKTVLDNLEMIERYEVLRAELKNRQNDSNIN